MSVVTLVGSGAVAVRAARQLVDTPGVDEVRILARDHGAAGRLARAVGAEAVDPHRGIAPGVDALAVAIPGPVGVAMVRDAVALGIPAASCADDPPALRGLLELGPAAFDAGVRVVAGCGLAPGLADLLARHAADALEDPDEVHVARVGVAGASCARALRSAGRAGGREWRDGRWHEPDRTGPLLVWFPDPVAARECSVVDGGVDLVQGAVPEASYVTVRAELPERASARWRLRRARPSDEFGGARVEVWGWKEGRRESLVYGVIERPAVAAGTTLAVVAARLAGALPDVALRADDGGARAVGATFAAPTFLAELAHRGVKVAAFVGSSTRP